ncbi:sodium:alanine symporter family protein [bacterium]|jgi:alanine or glycine:cation symporter, AGCS family|nr:sodium:alanine symporter family protein [bacterium]MBT5015027.1 sodium:alanine symporter family protein [bacterium]
MNWFCFFEMIDSYLALPALTLFLAVGIILTFKTRFIQFRSLGRFIRIITAGPAEDVESGIKTVSPFKALFTAMATTIGMGNMVGPTVAILMGGPGALFWLVFYSVISCVTKYGEVSFALHTRDQTSKGQILGGPAQYLKLVNNGLAHWYGFVTIFLFAGWSGLQTNTLAEILVFEGVVPWVTGLSLAAIVLIVLAGGVERVSSFASKLVPIMFILYVSFALTILFYDPVALWAAIKLMFKYAFTPAAPIGGFIGASLFNAVRIGTHRAAYITECGVGTSSIAHAFSDVKNISDQAILAMYSVFADTFLCLISGLIVLITGIWQQCGFTSTMTYFAFRAYSPYYGKYILVASVIFFVITTLIGNTFNGSLSFASYTRYRFMRWYYVFSALVIFFGSMMPVPLVWKMMDVILVLVAIPHLIGLLVITWRYPQMLKEHS